ncbi:murein transglycosylase [Agromyces badenianii]|uniref:Murein transglycosylase n=1 Tax=Agromyces badenianii TaxID=2080742 RepID=A0A2S0WZ33_9MICO|nr:lytic murein transglycosylase [Agromyces badenianii]AWB96454.1 murein transglycosylase [Agromyces badenianii]
MPSPGDRTPRAASAPRWAAVCVVAAFVGLLGWLVGGVFAYSEPGAHDRLASSLVSDAIDPVAEPPAGLAELAAPDAAPASVRGNADRVDPAWAAATATRTGIPVRAVRAYAGAELAIRGESPDCHLGWSTLAGIGHLESGHGTHAGSALDERGVARPAILGPDLDGTEFAAIDDTDGGLIDGSARVDRAVGPMQFIPSTWARWGADGDGEGTADPQQIDDAALAAGRYLCSSGDLSDPSGWRRAIFSYNHVEAYVDAVADAANRYAQSAPE